MRCVAPSPQQFFLQEQLPFAVRRAGAPTLGSMNCDGGASQGLRHLLRHGHLAQHHSGLPTTLSKMSHRRQRCLEIRKEEEALQRFSDLISYTAEQHFNGKILNQHDMRGLHQSPSPVSPVPVASLHPHRGPRIQISFVTGVSRHAVRCVSCVSTVQLASFIPVIRSSRCARATSNGTTPVRDTTVQSTNVGSPISSKCATHATL